MIVADQDLFSHQYVVSNDEANIFAERQIFQRFNRWLHFGHR